MAQELSSTSDSCMAKKVRTIRGSNCQEELQFLSWRDLSSWLKAVLLEKSLPSFQSTRWRIVWLTENKKGSNAQLFYFGQTFFLQDATVEIKRKKKVSSERNKFCLRSPGSAKGESYIHRLRKSNRLARKYSESWVKALPKASYMSLERIPMSWIKIGQKN